MTKNELYDKFLENFPNFKSQVKAVYSKGNNAIKIYTKYNKSFIFEVNDEGINLRQG